MGTVVTTVQKGIEPFSPLRTEQLPGGSKILDQNLDRLKKHLDAMTPVVNQITRTLNIRITGGGTVPQFTPGGVIFADSLGNLADDPAKLAYDDAMGILTIAGLTPGGFLKASSTGAIQLATESAHTLLGNPTGSAAGVQEISLDATLAFSGSALGRAAISGDVVISAGSNTATIQPHVVSYGKMQQESATTLLGNPTGGLADVREIPLGTGLGFSAGALVNTSPASGISWPAATDVIVSTGSGPTGDSAFTYDTAAHTLSLTGATPISLPLAGTQIINKHGGALNIRTDDAHGLLLGTNATTAISITPTQQVNVTSLNAGGIVISSAGQLGLAVAGVDYAPPGNYITALTGDVTATGPGSAAATLATVATAGTYGSTGSYLSSQTIDAKGRTTAVGVTSTPLAGALVYTLASSALSMGQNQSTLVLPLPAGAPIINTAAAGVPLATTLSANWGSSVQSPPTFAYGALGSVRCTGDITFYAYTGASSPTLVTELWYTTGNPLLPGNWHSIASSSRTLTGGSGNSFGGAASFSASSGTGLIPAGSSLLLVLYRSDANAGTTITTLNLQIVCALGS
jgi:hypothetical protein